jgi:pilus assembly protein CpaE
MAANKVASGAGEISRSDFETSIERKLNFAIPVDFKAAANAAKLGQTFVGANRTAKATHAIRAIADAIIASEGEREAAAPAHGVKGGKKPVRSQTESETPKGSGSLLDRFAIKKLLSKSKPGVPA